MRGLGRRVARVARRLGAPGRGRLVVAILDGPQTAAYAAAVAAGDRAGAAALLAAAAGERPAADARVVVFTERPDGPQ